MTTSEQEQAIPQNSQDTKRSSQTQSEYKYRFSEGETISERYRVIIPLGFGGFAEVYHCQDMRLDRDVAVKVLKEKGVGLKEARAAARLQHAHIVQVYDVSELEDATPFVVFRYIEGETLQQRLRCAPNRRLPLDEDALAIILQVAEAMDYAHEKGVIHRDVKPSNIMLDPKGNAYLTDFGLAEVKRPAEEESALTTKIQQRLSGTIPYMAPEQLRTGIPGNERSDLYSLGVVVYEMLTGQLPYQGQDASLIVQIVTEDPLTPTTANPELPKGVERVLLRVLDKDPDKRPSSCVACARELGDASKAHVEANKQYPSALKLFEAKQWRQALAAFEIIERRAPGFKDTAHYLEQTRHHVRLLGLYEQAEKALEQGEYRDTLDALNTLTQLAPDYAVEEVRRRARAGLAQEEKRSLNEQYQQAVRQFQEGQYQACLDTLAVIRESDPQYPDLEDIEAPAREHVERQQHLRGLYTQGVEQVRQRQWEEAVATFSKLQKEAPGYEDVETRLLTTRHLARMSSLLDEARDLLKQGDFAACVDKLEEAQRVDDSYEKDEVDQLRREALDGLYDQANHLLREGKFEESLAALAELKKRAPGYSGVGKLEAQAREGIQIRDLRANLDHLYAEAVEQIGRRDYAAALKLWQTIQQQKEELDYPDPKDIEIRAREGLCTSLYNQALGASAQGDHQRALELLEQIEKVDPNYPDNQRIEERALARIEKREKIKYWTVRLGGGVIGLLLLIGLVIAIVRGCDLAPTAFTATPSATATVSKSSATPQPTATVLTPSATPQATRTRAPSPTPTMVPNTPTPSPTSPPTSTPTTTPSQTPSPTATPSATPTPDNRATATLGSSIFAAPDVNSQEIGIVAVGDWALVLGRSAYGQWFYIRNDQGIEGFVYAPRFEWSGDYDSLPVKSPITGPSVPTPTRETSGSTLRMDLWDMSGRCSGGTWYKTVYIEGHGGNGVYTYYWNGERIAGPTSGSHVFEVHSTGGAIIGTGKVVSGDGQTIEEELFIREPDCAN